MKKRNQFLNIKGAVLDNEQLGIYMEKAAASHDLMSNSNMDTYPIYRLKENLSFIEKTYSLLNNHIEKEIDIYPSGEWILDNFYAIEETVHTVIKELTPKKYKSFPGLVSTGYSRIYVLATEIIAHTDGRINEDVLNLAIISYQKRKTLSMEEIWNLWIFLDIAIIENIRNTCEKIYSAQMQKYKVESILERLVEKKSIKECKYVGSGLGYARASVTKHVIQRNAISFYRIYVI